MARKPKPYYLLLERDGAGENWRIELGSYDREDVVFERQCYREGYRAVKASNLKIVQLSDAKQSTIDTLLWGLNRSEQLT